MNNSVHLDTTPFRLVEIGNYFEDRFPPTLWQIYVRVHGEENAPSILLSHHRENVEHTLMRI
jgi:hypothetical protein